MRQFIHRAARDKKYRQRPQDFTRASLLNFTTLSTLILSGLKNSLTIELVRFFSQLGLPCEWMVTKSAFSQARHKIPPRFFAELFTHMVELSFQTIKIKRWPGFRIWAMDGSGLRLSDIEQLGDRFGWRQNQHNRVPSARLRGWYDVLNRICTRLELRSRHEDELTTAGDWVKDLPKDVLMIYDRGYFGFNLPWLHHRHQTHFIIRCPLGATTIIQEFLASGKHSQTVDFKAGDRSTRSMRRRGFSVQRYHTVKVRLIRIHLKDGQPPEVLMTNLLDTQRYPTRYFRYLYNLRWKIETYWDILKNIFAVGSFSGYSETAVWQDLYATVIRTNLQSVLHADCQKELRRINRRRVRDYQINRNISAGHIKDFFTRLFLGPIAKVQQWIQQLHTLLLQSLERIIPDQTRPRRFKILDRKRHETEKNYRRV